MGVAGGKELNIILVGAKEFGKRRRRQDIAIVDVDLVCHRARNGRHFGA